MRGRRERGREEVNDGGRYLEISRILSCARKCSLYESLLVYTGMVEALAPKESARRHILTTPWM